MNFKGLEREHDVEDDGEIICKCFAVTDTKIKRVALQNNLHSLEEITNYTKAGGGCGACQYRIEEILDDLWREQSEKKVPQKMSFLQRIKKIEEVLEGEIRPILRGDGGDVELIDVADNTVTVQLMGMCQGCHASGLTVKGLVEEKLKELVDPAIEVVQHEL
jgi:NifU-like protein